MVLTGQRLARWLFLQSMAVRHISAEKAMPWYGKTKKKVSSMKITMCASLLFEALQSRSTVNSIDENNNVRIPFIYDEIRLRTILAPNEDQRKFIDENGE